MTDFNYIENYIIDFVDRHVSEKVYVVIKPKSVSIKPVKKRGSILLSMFWIKILQHKNNFPTQTVSYNRKKVDNSEIVYFFVNDVMISLNLLNGTVMVDGESAMNWFKLHILEVIRNYTGCKDSSKALKSEQMDWNTISSSYNHKVHSHLLSQYPQSTVLEEDHLSKLMVDSVLDAACENIRNSSLKPSKEWIYRFWKSLLYKWCSNPNIKIVIASSQIDPTRFQDIADISLLLRATSQILGIYLPYNCDNSGIYKYLGNVKKATLAPYNPGEQIWIESELFNQITMPRNGIGCNFIAGILPDNKTELMVTSCRFHGIDIDQDCLHSVQFIEMSELQFDKNYVSHLQSQ